MFQSLEHTTRVRKLNIDNTILLNNRHILYLPYIEESLQILYRKLIYSYFKIAYLINIKLLDKYINNKWKKIKLLMDTRIKIRLLNIIYKVINLNSSIY